MLNELNLDDQDFECIVEEARNKIMGIFGDWTDFNYHDPGITLIELFAWIKEYQQYYLNQTGNEVKLKFLKLLGIQKKHRNAASALLQFTAKETEWLYRGTKVYAGNICFETVKSKQLVKNDIFCMISVRKNQIIDFVDRTRLQLENRIIFYPFGKDPKEEDAFYLAVDSALPKQQPIRLYFDIWEEYGVSRNKIEKKLYAPLSVFSVESYSENGWEEMEWTEDLTFGLLVDGFLTFSIKHNMKKVNIQGQEGYYIRILLKNQEYDVPPCITRVSINIEEARQRDTLCEYEVFELIKEGDMGWVSLDSILAADGDTEVYYEKNGVFFEAVCVEKQILENQGMVKIGVSFPDQKSEINQVLLVNRDFRCLEKSKTAAGNGLPFQQINLEDSDIEYESFALMVQEESFNGFRIWEKTEDFGGSGNGDRHYIMDAVTGCLHFGDGIHGRMPKGVIKIVSYVRTLGSRGNVKENKINHLHMKNNGEDRVVWNIENAINGMDEESIKDCFLRGRKSLVKPHCAVTEGDYENYVMEAPGLMIEACKVISSGLDRNNEKTAHTVTLAVKPFHTEKKIPLSKAYEKNIRAYLEPYRMLGTSIKFRQPEYIPVLITVQVLKNIKYQNITKKVEEALLEYFASRECSFGITLQYGQLYGLLDQLPEVSSIRWLSVEVKSNMVNHLAGGDIVLPANGLMYLQEVSTSVLTEG